MKIIKKQPDFYDSVLGYGVDNSIVYIREEEEVQVLKHWSSESFFSSYSRTRSATDEYNALHPTMKTLVEKLSEHHFKERLVGDYMRGLSAYGYYIVFAGELIPVLHIEGTVGSYPNDTKYDEYIYSADQLISFLYKTLGEDKAKQLMSRKEDFSDSLKFMQKANLFFDQRKEGLEDFHHDFNCPIILIQSKGYVKNPILKKLNFQRCYDAFTTYQKLEMFISGVLGGQSPKMVEIDDIHRIASHGFDTKMSFRKRKG